LATWPDIILVAPASADLIGKVAHGLADEILSTLLCVTQKRVLWCPSLNVQMWNNPRVQNNLTILRGDGHVVLSPDEGPQACGMEGPGRLPETKTIVDFVWKHLSLAT
jgi:phosphopantothenoylcysteine decarboxylase/phosphopantothenate--cysteine ligase